MTSPPFEEDPAQFLISEDLVPSIIQKQSQTVALTFDGLLDPPLILHTNEKECGGQLWPAGMVLAKYMIESKLNALKGRTMFVRSEDSLRLKQAGIPTEVC